MAKSKNFWSKNFISLANIWARLYKSLWCGVQKVSQTDRGELDGLRKIGDGAKCQRKMFQMIKKKKFDFFVFLIKTWFFGQKIQKKGSVVLFFELQVWVRAQEIIKMYLNWEYNFFEFCFRIFFFKNVLLNKRWVKRDHDLVASASGLGEGSKIQKNFYLLEQTKKLKKNIFEFHLQKTIFCQKWSKIKIFWKKSFFRIVSECFKTWFITKILNKVFSGQSTAHLT